MSDSEGSNLPEEIITSIKCEPFEITYAPAEVEEKKRSPTRPTLRKRPENAPNHPIAGHSRDKGSSGGYPLVCAKHLAHILLHYKILAKTATEAYNEICMIYGKKVISIRSCYRLYGKLKIGKIGDLSCPCCVRTPKKRSGRPSKINTAKIKDFHKANPNMPLQDMSRRLGIPKSTVHWHINKVDTKK